MTSHSTSSVHRRGCGDKPRPRSATTDGVHTQVPGHVRWSGPSSGDRQEPRNGLSGTEEKQEALSNHTLTYQQSIEDRYKRPLPLNTHTTHQGSYHPSTHTHTQEEATYTYSTPSPTFRMRGWRLGREG